jgi:hypothetical protein
MGNLPIAPAKNYSAATRAGPKRGAVPSTGHATGGATGIGASGGTATITGAGAGAGSATIVVDTASTSTISRLKTSMFWKLVCLPVKPTRSSQGSVSARRYSQPSRPRSFITIVKASANRSAVVFAPRTFSPRNGAGTTLYSNCVIISTPTLLRKIWDFGPDAKPTNGNFAANRGIAPQPRLLVSRTVRPYHHWHVGPLCANQSAND